MKMPLSIVATAVALALTPVVWTAAQETSWKGEKVIPVKRAKDIQFGDTVEGKRVDFTYSGRWPLAVQDERAGLIRIDDGRHEGWASKSDFVPAGEAPAYFQKRIDANAQDTWALSMRGAQRQLAGKSDEALQDFNECLRLDPTDARVLNNRGNVWISKKDYDRAIKDLDESIRLDPADPRAFFNRGTAWRDKHDNDRAIKDYDEAIRLDPKYVRAYNSRGIALADRRDYDLAIKDFGEAIRLDPKFAKAYVGRGSAWRAKLEDERAMQDYEEAVRLDPKDHIAVFSRGNLWRDRKEYDRAIQDYDKAMQLNPKHGRSLFGRATTLMLARRPKAAEGFRAMLELQEWKGDKSVEAVVLGHLAARQEGDEAAAAKFLQDSAGKFDAAWPNPVLRFLRGELDEAGLLKAADEPGKQTEARCYLALDQVFKGKKEAALAHLRWVKENGVSSFTEYHIAIAELERLEKAGK